MKWALAVGCALLLTGCDQKSESAIPSKMESIRTVATSAPEDVQLIGETDQTVIESAGQQVSAEHFPCAEPKHMWLVRFTGKQAIKIVKVECTEGDCQLTLFDNKAYTTPWTGVLLGVERESRNDFKRQSSPSASSNEFLALIAERIAAE